MDYKHNFTEIAKQDLRNIIAYLTQNTNISFTKKIEMEIKNKIIKVCKEPKLYQISKLPRLQKEKVRAIPVEGYLVFYQIDEKECLINIARIRSDRQDNKNIKLQ